MQDIQPKHVIEAALLAAEAPMSVASLRVLFEDEIDKPGMLALLAELQADWSGRGVQLAETATGWRFQTAPDMAIYLERLNPERPARYSRAVMETLAIIAYRQPVTRGDIEDIRGVSVSSQVIKSLEDRAWIEVIGHKDVLGRPSLFGTTRKFLDDLGLASIGDLPELKSSADLAAMGDALEQQVIEFPADPLAPAGAAPGGLEPGDLGDAVALADKDAAGEEQTENGQSRAATGEDGREKLEAEPDQTGHADLMQNDGREGHEHEAQVEPADSAATPMMQTQEVINESERSDRSETKD